MAPKPKIRKAVGRIKAVQVSAGPSEYVPPLPLVIETPRQGGANLGDRGALSEEARLLEPLAYLLQPLLEAEAASGSEKKSKGAKKGLSLGSLSLSVLVSVTELAQSCVQQQRGGAAKSPVPISPLGRGASFRALSAKALFAASDGAVARAGESVLRAESAARRVKIVARTIKDSASTAEREAALTELVRLVEGNRSLCAAIEAEGAIPALVDLTARGSLATKALTVGLLRKVRACRLVGLARAENRAIRDADAATAARATECAHARARTPRAQVAQLGESSQTAIATAGGIAPVVKVLVGGAATPQLREEACHAIGFLARGHADNQAAIEKAGALPALLRLLTNGTSGEGEQLGAAAALMALCAANERLASALVANGGVAPLAAFVLPTVFAATQLAPASSSSAALEALHAALRGEAAGVGAAPPGTAKPLATKAALRVLAAVLPEPPDATGQATFRCEAVEA